METLAHLCVKFLKNPCDGSQSQKLGSFYPYCYFLQRQLKIADEINSKQCTCKNECKTENGMCEFLSNGRHTLSCSRTLCNGCKLFRKYGFACYEMVFTNNPLTFERCIKQLTLMLNDNNIIIKDDFTVVSNYCYHSDDYQLKPKCVVFQPTTYMFYEIPEERKLTDNEKFTLNQMAIEQIPESLNQTTREGRELVEYIYQILKNAFYYKLLYMQKESKLYLNIHHLIHLNNLMISGKNTMLRQEQNLKWNPKTKVQKYAMDCRCIRYHLNMLIFVFNNRFISNSEFITNFLHLHHFLMQTRKLLKYYYLV